MERKSLAFFGIALAAMAAIGFFTILNPSLTGLATLPGSDKNQSLADGKASGKVSAELSVKTVGETSLKASLLDSEIRPCPSFIYLDFEVWNSGNEIAERIFVKPSENLNVIECVNCSLNQLAPGEKTIIKLKACKTDGKETSVGFSSINALEEKVTIG